MKRSVWDNILLTVMKLCNCEGALKRKVRQIIDMGGKNGYTKEEMILLWEEKKNSNSLERIIFTFTRFRFRLFAV